MDIWNLVTIAISVSSALIAFLSLVFNQRAKAGLTITCHGIPGPGGSELWEIRNTGSVPLRKFVLYTSPNGQKTSLKVLYPGLGIGVFLARGASIQRVKFRAPLALFPVRWEVPESAYELEKHLAQVRNAGKHQGGFFSLVGQ